MRNEITKLVKNIQPFDALEDAHRLNVLQWIESGVDIFRIQKPATPPKHLVSYFVVIDPEKHSVLLVDHLKAQKWLPPGGHVEINEHPRITVMREAQEELSLEASFLLKNPFFITETVTVGTTSGHTDVSLWFVIRGDVNTEILFDPKEFRGVRWFSYDEILNMNIDTLDPHMYRFMKKWLTLGSVVG